MLNTYVICPLGFENAAQGLWPQEAFSSPRLTCLFPAVNWPTSGFVYTTVSLNRLTCLLQMIRKKIFAMTNLDTRYKSIC